MMQWLVLALGVYFTCSYFWTMDPLTTLEKVRAYFSGDDGGVVLRGEVAETAEHLRWMLRAPGGRLLGAGGVNGAELCLGEHACGGTDSVCGGGDGSERL